MTEFLSMDYNNNGALVALERQNASMNSWAWIDTSTMQWYAYSEYDAGVRYFIVESVP